MVIPHPRFHRVFAFGIGMILVILALILSGRVNGHGPGCSMGLAPGKTFPTYTAYASTTYGWPFAAIVVERIACQGPPEQWAPHTEFVFYPLGVIVSLLQVLMGGLLLDGIVSRWVHRP